MSGNFAFAVVGPLLVLYLLQTPSVSHAALAVTLALLISACAACATFILASRNGEIRWPGELPSRRILLTYSANVWVTGLLAGLVWNRGEFGILKMYVQSNEIAVYSAALTLSGTITQATGLLTGALIPHLAMHWQAGDKERIGAILRQVTQLTLMCSTIFAAMLIGQGKAIILLIFGSAYSESYDVLCVLAIAAISISSGSANTALQIKTDARFVRDSNFAGLALLVVISVTLTPYFGILGAAVARAAAQVFIGVYVFWTLAGVDSLRESARSLMAGFIFVVAATTAYFFITKMFQSDFVASIAITLIFVGSMLVAIRLIIRERIGVYFRIDRLFAK